MVDRRELLTGGATMIGGMMLGGRAFAAAPSLQRVARDAWLYAVPLVEVANVRRRILASGPANVFVHNRNLTNVQTQKVTSPNNDTMYSRAMLDLRAVEPFRRPIHARIAEHMGLAGSGNCAPRIGQQRAHSATSALSVSASSMSSPRALAT